MRDFHKFHNFLELAARGCSLLSRASPVNPGVASAPTVAADLAELRRTRSTPAERRVPSSRPHAHRKLEPLSLGGFLTSFVPLTCVRSRRSAARGERLHEQPGARRRRRLRHRKIPARTIQRREQLRGVVLLAVLRDRDARDRRGGQVTGVPRSLSTLPSVYAPNPSSPRISTG